MEKPANQYLRILAGGKWRGRGQWMEEGETMQMGEFCIFFSLIHVPNVFRPTCVRMCVCVCIYVCMHVYARVCLCALCHFGMRIKCGCRNRTILPQISIGSSIIWPKMEEANWKENGTREEKAKNPSFSYFFHEETADKRWRLFIFTMDALLERTRR